MTEPLTPKASPSDSRIVEDCPTCKRIKWTNATCTHGAIPLRPTGNNADAPKGQLKGGLGK